MANLPATVAARNKPTSNEVEHQLASQNITAAIRNAISTEENMKTIQPLLDNQHYAEKPVLTAAHRLQPTCSFKMIAANAVARDEQIKQLSHARDNCDNAEETKCNCYFSVVRKQ